MNLIVCDTKQYVLLEIELFALLTVRIQMNND